MTTPDSTARSDSALGGPDFMALPDGPAPREPNPPAVSALRASVPNAEFVARFLQDKQVDALLAMPFLSRNCGFSPGCLRALRESESFKTKPSYPRLADYTYHDFYNKLWRRTAFGDAVAQAIEARRAETQGGSVYESAVAEGHAPEPQPPQNHLQHKG